MQLCSLISKMPFWSSCMNSRKEKTHMTALLFGLHTGIFHLEGFGYICCYPFKGVGIKRYYFLPEILFLAAMWVFHKVNQCTALKIAVFC